MRIDRVPDVLLSTSPAVRSFLFDFKQIAPAFEYDWRSQESFTRRAAYLKEEYRGDRKAVAAALRAYNQALGAGAATLEKIDLLEQSSTLVVATGQQGGVFTGPAYSIYKAMTAIHLARQQSERLGVPVVPVFWIAGEDHDWPEHAAVMVPAGDGAARVALKESFEGERRSVGLAPMPDSVPEVIAEFLDLLPETDFKAEVATRIQEAFDGPPALDRKLTGGHPTLNDWFGRLMTWIFAGSGLIMLNAVDPALRALESGFFEKALRRRADLEAALEQSTRLYEEMGFQPTVESQPGNTFLFTYLMGDRVALLGNGERFWVRGHDEVSWSLGELVDLVHVHPQFFSTNVVLRPLVQGVLLPDLAHVGGPGEVSYFGLYRAVYRAMDQQMPIIYPRESYTLIEPPLARIMEKNAMTLGDLFFRLDERRQEFLDREDRLGIADLFQRFRADFERIYEPLAETVLQLDPNLQHSTEENRRQIEHQIQKLEEKAGQQHRKNLEVFLRQYDRLKANLTPPGAQERSFSILPYLAKYGPDLVARLLAETELAEGWEHRAVYLGS